MQVKDLINQACTKTGQASADNVPNPLWDFCLGALNRLYEDIWNVYPFRDEKIVSLAVTGTSEELVFPQIVEAVRALWTVDNPLFPLNELIMVRMDPAVMAEEGTPVRFFNLPDEPVLTQPSAANQIKVVSASASDDGTIAVIGTDTDDVEMREEIVLDGTTPVQASGSFAGLRSITKPLTYGRVTVTLADATEIGTIPAWRQDAQYRKIRLYPIPSEASFTLYIEGLRRFEKLTSQHDSPLLTKCHTAMFDLLMAEVYEYAGMGEKAVAERKKGGERLEVALMREKHTDAEDIRSLPAYGMFGDGAYPIDTSKTGTGVGWVY